MLNGLKYRLIMAIHVPIRTLLSWLGYQSQAGAGPILALTLRLRQELLWQNQVWRIRRWRLQNWLDEPVSFRQRQLPWWRVLHR